MVYFCEFCPGKSFVHRQSLYRHKMTHQIESSDNSDNESTIDNEIDENASLNTSLKSTLKRKRNVFSSSESDNSDTDVTNSSDSEDEVEEIHHGFWQFMIHEAEKRHAKAMESKKQDYIHQGLSEKEASALVKKEFNANICDTLKNGLVKLINLWRDAKDLPTLSAIKKKEERLQKLKKGKENP